MKTLDIMPPDEEELLEDILDEMHDETDEKFRIGHIEHFDKSGSLGDKPALWALREGKKEHIDGYVYGYVGERQVMRSIFVLEDEDLSLEERISKALKYLKG